MKKEKLTTKLFSLSCENDKGILTRIITTFNRAGYDIETLSQSRTELSEIVLITMEVAIPGIKIDSMIRRLHKIIGVIDVTISFWIGNELRDLQVGSESLQSGYLE